MNHRFTVKEFCAKNPVAACAICGLVSEGYDPYGKLGEVDVPNDTHAGIVAYFFDEDFCEELNTRLCTITPPMICDGVDGRSYATQRWHVHHDIDDDNMADFVKSAMSGEFVAVYDGDNQIGFILKKNITAVYIILAVLNQGPLPEGVDIPIYEVNSI